jgi:hypothetical protein
MLPDDLLGRVSLEALRPRIPGQHVSLRIERENRIIDHAFDQQPVQLAGWLIGRAQRVLRWLGGPFRRSRLNSGLFFLLGHVTSWARWVGSS